MKLARIGKAAILGLAMATGIATGCSSKTESPTASTGNGDPTGSVAQELRLGRSTHINKANYTLTGPNGFSKSGTFDVSQLRELEGEVTGVPVGSPYTLSVTANSTNGNVSCSGSKSGITVTCPGNRPQDEKTFKLTCTRNHVGREWGDDDWKENMRTFTIGAEVNLDCAQVDAGSDATVDAAPDTGPDVVDAAQEADVCTPSNAACGSKTCGTASDGCGGMVNCGPNNGACAAGQTCVAPGTCVVCNATCPAPDNCGSVTNPAGCPVPTLNCGTCPTTFPNTTCGGGPTPTPNVCGCSPSAASAVCGSKVCGTAPDGCGGTVNCGPLNGGCPASAPTCDGSGQCLACATSCPSGDNCGTFTNPAGCAVTSLNCGTCPTTFPNTTCGGGPTPKPNVCGCSPSTATAACGGKVCGTAPDGCGGTVNCGPNAGACPASAPTCTASGTCVACATSCPSPDNCGSITNPAGCPTTTVSCGTCPTTFPNTTCGPAKANVCQCIPSAPSAVCGSKVCGTAPDGCGGTVNCGPNAGACPGTQVCDATGTCQACATSCPAGDDCSTIGNPAVCPNPTVTCGPNGGACPTTFPNTTCGGGPTPTPNHCGCSPSTAAAACGSKICGTAPNGCGGTVNCGPLAGACPMNQACDSTGACVACAASCPAGDDCGTVSNPAACPNPTLTCGTNGGACPTATAPNSVCGGGPTPTPNHCGCTPTAAATACGSNNCGTAPNGCGGTVNCGPNGGACAANQTCTIPAGSTAGTCTTVGPPPGACDPTNPNATTATCIAAQNKTTTTDPTKVCSTCVVANGCFDPAQQGGTCETTTGNATFFSGTLPDGKTCSQVFAPLASPVSETQVCLDVLNTVFTTKCAASLQETPCVCGNVPVGPCTSGATQANGPGFDEFACDFNSTNVGTINAVETNFTVQTFGAGQANALIQCAAINSCDCF